MWYSFYPGDSWVELIVEYVRGGGGDHKRGEILPFKKGVLLMKIEYSPKVVRCYTIGVVSLLLFSIGLRRENNN